ncbi:MAG: hypothetical protein K0R67_1669 [Paenibacillus sp.]|jgi:hypothetical protein|nr:hypothetical protein [Paenibacillus sp.]
MTISKRSSIQVFLHLLFALVLFSFCLSPVYEMDVSVKYPYTASSLEMTGTVHAANAVKNSMAPHRLIPAPFLPLIFVIATLLLYIRVIRIRNLLHPTVYLLRKPELLLPVKFASIYVSLPARTSNR